MRRLRWLLGILVLLSAPQAELRAQQLRGVVLDSAVGAPISGVVVIVLDASGAAGARAITDAAGRFTVLASPSTARLRLMRIGYRLRDVAVTGKRDVELRFAMEKVPPILERVRVSGTELCPGSTDRGAAFQLWEQARSGLLATVVARDLKPADAKTLIYESVLSANDEIVRKQTKRINAGRTSRPFVSSAGADFFARAGYMIEDTRGRLFNAPDADVLLHESFAMTHCFRMRAADAEHAGQTGLAFSPIPGRDTLVDVSGVIWMDATAAQLRSLDFAYTSLEPAAMAIRPGGHIEFRSMPNGASFIERWYIRLPNVQTNLEPQGHRSVVRDGVGRRDRTDVHVAEIIETGGLVVEARWSDGAEWIDVPAIASGVVKQRKSDVPVSDAVVTLVGTSDTTATDNAGEFEIQAIPGRYLVRVADTTLQAFVKARAQTLPVVITRTGVQPMRVELPPVSEVLGDVCRDQRMSERSAIVTGYVATSDASSLSGTRVRGRWQADFIQSAGGLSVNTSTQDVEIDEDGRFVLCGVARERPVNLQLSRGTNKLADTTFRVMAVGLTHRVQWLVTPPTTAVANATLERSGTSDATGHTVSGDTARHQVAAAAPERLRVFETHAATRAGTYISDSTLRLRAGSRLADALPLLVQGLRTWRVGKQIYVVAPIRNGPLARYRDGWRCVATVYVNAGVRWDAAQLGVVPPFSIGEYWVDDIAAVEFYPSGTTLPVEYRRTRDGCGTLVLWTR